MKYYVNYTVKAPLIDSMMKLSFLLALGACALVINSKAVVNSDNAQRIGDLRGRLIYADHPNIDPEHIDDSDPENIANAERTVKIFQNDAVMYGAKTTEEIDQFVKIAWYAMYLKVALLERVKPQGPLYNY